MIYFTTIIIVVKSVSSYVINLAKSVFTSLISNDDIASTTRSVSGNTLSNEDRVFRKASSWYFIDTRNGRDKNITTTCIGVGFIINF